MYYVIQVLHHTGNKHFISYKVPKYILSSKNENIIFELGEKPNIKRKWANKNDIILLTENKAFFLAYLKKLTSIEETHLEKIDHAQKEVERLIQNYEETIKEELDSFKKLSQNNENVPTLL